MTDPSYYLPLARAAEEANFDSMVGSGQHLLPRENPTTRYPFNPDGARGIPGGQALLGALLVDPGHGSRDRAAALRHRFVVAELAHSPAGAVVAKQVSSTAVLTGNRLLLGVGTSPWPEDYTVCGVPWEGRGKRMDEQIEVIRGLMAGGYFEYHGEVFDLPSVKMSPTPTKPVPILIGGHHEAALRRAAVSGDGWLHGGGDPGDLPGLLARLAVLRAEHGTEGKPFEVHVMSLDAYSLDGVRQLEGKWV